MFFFYFHSKLTRKAQEKSKSTTELPFFQKETSIFFILIWILLYSDIVFEDLKLAYNYSPVTQYY